MQLDDEEREALERDVEFGQKSRAMLEEMVGPYFQLKQYQLIEAFRSTPVRDTEALVAIHHQFKIIDQMHEELESGVKMGKISLQTLIDEDKTEEIKDD